MGSTLGRWQCALQGRKWGADEKWHLGLALGFATYVTILRRGRDHSRERRVKGSDGIERASEKNPHGNHDYQGL